MLICAKYRGAYNVRKDGLEGDFAMFLYADGDWEGI